MRGKTILIGLLLVVIGVGIYVYYDYFIKPDRSAKELLVEAKFVSERGDQSSINSAIDIYRKIIIKYPTSRYVPEAYYQIARSYENIGLQRLAYLKYIYLIKSSNRKVSPELRKEVMIRLAHINVLKQYSEEAVSQLYNLLSNNYDKEFRSRIYSELGHTYLKQKEYAKAKRMFDISLAEFGNNEEAILGQARSLKWMGNDSAAYDLYEHFLKYYGAVSQYTNDVRKSYKEQAYQSGLNAFRTGRYSASVSFFGRVLRNFPYDRITENALYWTGEAYYGMGKFDTAISYFNRALSNGFYHKDEDARIKKGYAYFVTKRFDLAAKEFEIYLQNNSNRKYRSIAENWKNTSTKELLYRIRTKKLPEARDLPKIDEDELKENTVKEAPDSGDEELDEDVSATQETDEEISGDYYEDTINGERIELENVAEL